MTRYAATIDALVALARTTNAVTVYDGPPNTADIPADFVVIGGTDDPDDDAGEIRADWLGIGAKTRSEESEVTCVVVSQSGDDDLPAHRLRVLDLLGQITAAIKADPSLGVLAPGWAHVTAATPRQRRNTNGTYVRLSFTVSYQTRF